MIKYVASTEPTPINTAQYELNHSLTTTSHPLHGTIYHSTAGGIVQSTFFTLTRTGLAKWSRGARWDGFHPWCFASGTEKCLKNATPQSYGPQSKTELGRARLSAMPDTSSSQEGASWCSSLLCTGMHPAHHPGKNKEGLASAALPSESIPGFLCKLHLLNNL